MDELWNELVSASILVPSGGNKQPWQWTATENGKLDLYLDKMRSSGLIDFENSGSHSALSCTAENLVLASHAAGLEVSLKPFASADDDCHVAVFRLLPSSSNARELSCRHDLHSQIPPSCTQRNPGKHQPIAAADLGLLAAAVHSVAGARVQWHTDRSQLHETWHAVAWYKVRDRRYDCARLAKPRYVGCACAQDLEEVLGKLEWTLRRSPFHQPEAALQFASSITDIAPHIPGIPAGVIQ